MGYDTVRLNVFMFAPMVFPALFLIWWLFFSRVWHMDRWLILGACVAIGAAAYFLYHKSMVMGIMFFVVPVVITAWTAWLLVTPWMRWPARSAGLIVVLLLAWGSFTVQRFDGIDGNFDSAVSLRWTPTDEQRFMAERKQHLPKPTEAAVAAAPAPTLVAGDWPGFRGANRDSRLPGVRINTDWSKNPPKELWKRRVGPGWSSFAVVGNRLYTQEQRDKDEVVVCYDANTGEEIWTHTDTARFEEPVAGAGPRATPTFHEGRLYTLGAAGQLNCLDAVTGKPLWTRDVLKDADAKNQQWGLAASPLVYQGIVSVYAGGPDGKAVIGYNASTGEKAWTSGNGKFGYCSTQLAKLNGKEQLLIVTDAGLFGMDPASGAVLWTDEWNTSGNDENKVARILQPAVIGDSDVLISTAFEKGTRRVHIKYDGDKWSTETKWEASAFKPYYNDFVIHNGYLYGFQSGLFLCLNLEDGSIQWKERGYDNGQVMLLPDQNLLVVLTEKGAVALVNADPKKRTEVARFQAIQGKTWNHPVIAHGKLFVRNGVEMACFQLNPEQPETAGGK
jgi:outer membrane protein assembly factor BamB